MTTKTTSIIALTMIALAFLAGAVLWNQLPDQMASHWNANDQVDGYMSKFWGVFLMPLMTLGMFVLFMVVPNIDPLKANIAQFRESFQSLHRADRCLHALHPRADFGLEPRISGFQDERGNAAFHGCAIHCHWIYAAESQAQLLHRHPHPVDIVQ